MAKCVSDGSAGAAPAGVLSGGTVRMRYLASLLIALLLLGACSQNAKSGSGKNELAKTSGPFNIQVTIQADQPGRSVNPAILGSNVQWVDRGDELLERSGAEFVAPMLDRVKALSPPILRYPGGSLSDLYHWKDGIGELAARGENEHFFSHAKQRIMMGTQEFLELCEAVGAEPMITVNVLSGSAEEAAGWVALINKAGLKSRKTGKPLPKVRFWEIGNEPYLKDEGQKKLWISPETFGAKAGQIIRAMKAVDPTIQVGIPMRSDRLGRFPATPYPGFNERALKAVDAEFEFVTLHNAYAPLAVDKEYYDDDLYLALAAASTVARADFDSTRRLLKTLFPARTVKLAVTEFNALYSFGGKPTDRYIATLGGALVVADLLREFAETDDLQFANFWSLSGNWYFGAIATDGRPRPAYYVLQMYRRALRGRYLPVKLGSPLFDGPDVGVVPATKGAPVVTALATGEGEKTRLILINKDPANQAAAAVTLAGKPEIGSAGYTLLTGKNYFDTSESETQVTLETGEISGGPAMWKFAVPAHSMMVVEFVAPAKRAK